MRYRDTGPHERVEYWQGHMNARWSTGPRPAKPAKKGDTTTLTVHARNDKIRRHANNNRRVTRTLRRDTITALVTRINRARNIPEWAHNLAGGLSWWLNNNPHMGKYTITTLNNGQWRALSKI